jgi:hypothetical protein
MFLHVSFKIVFYTKTPPPPFHREAHLTLGEPVEYSIIEDFNLDFCPPYHYPVSSDVVLFITIKNGIEN